MAKKFDEIKNNPEFQALQGIEGVNPAELIKQAGGDPPEDPPEDPPAGDPPAGDPPAGSGDPPAGDPPAGDPPAGDPPAGDPPKGDPPKADPTPEQRGVVLKEIFGERFKTVEDVKNANIPGLIDEVETLRQTKTELETKLELKPKTNFANDEVALFNEFVKETGTRDYGVFNKINSAEVATMDSMEALVTKYVLDHPEQSGKEPQIRKYFEKKYNVDPDQVDEADLEINKLGMDADGASAKKALQDIKDKLKVPEPSQEPDAPKELTPEEKTNLQTRWGSVGQQVSTAYGKLNIPIKGGKDPLLDYEVSESEQKEITDFVKNYAVENQMELNETNVKMMSTMVYNQLMINKLPEIVHSVFEKARSMTEEQVHAVYENPSPARNTDTPPVPPEPEKTDFEKQTDEIFDAEMGKYDQ